MATLPPALSQRTGEIAGKRSWGQADSDQSWTELGSAEPFGQELIAGGGGPEGAPGWSGLSAKPLGQGWEHWKTVGAWQAPATGARGGWPRPLSAVPPLFPDECGIVAQISEPLAAADIPAYYISTFKFDHALVSVQLRPPQLGMPVRGSRLLASSCPLAGTRGEHQRRHQRPESQPSREALGGPLLLLPVCPLGLGPAPTLKILLAVFLTDWKIGPRGPQEGASGRYPRLLPLTGLGPKPRPSRALLSGAPRPSREPLASSSPHSRSRK